MTTEGQNKKSRTSNPEEMAVRAAFGPEGECTVIPFRRRHSRKMPEYREPAPKCAALDRADQEPFEGLEDVPMVYVPWHAEIGWRRRRISSGIPHWLRTVLLIAASTVYAATAVAVCLSVY
jgi:hypothetical protein